MKDETIKKSTRKNKKSNNDLQTALIKKALGYDVEEIVEEYLDTGEGEIKLTKKKVTKKNVPPDVTALKILFEKDQQSNLTELTDQQLEQEKQRLLGLLLEKQNEIEGEVKIARKKH